MTTSSRARIYLRLGRVSNLPTVWTNVLCGMALAGVAPRGPSVAVLGVALSLFYIGGMFLNDAYDREIDARERPERPIPAGLVGAAEVFAVGYALLAAGALLVGLHAWITGAGAAPVAASALLAGAIVLYDAWHKGNALSPVLMGLCRVLVYFTAALSVPGSIGFGVAGGATALLFYLIGLTAIAKQEARFTLRSIFAIGFLSVPFIYGMGALLAGPVGLAAYAAMTACVIHAIRLLRGARQDRGRIPRAVVTLIAGISLLDAVLIAGTGRPEVAVLAMAAFPVTLAMQRLVRGT